MTGSSPPRADARPEGPCARCIAGAVIGSAVVVGMLFITARAVAAVAQGRFRPAFR